MVDVAVEAVTVVEAAMEREVKIGSRANDGRILAVVLGLRIVSESEIR